LFWQPQHHEVKALLLLKITMSVSLDDHVAGAGRFPWSAADGVPEAARAFFQANGFVVYERFASRDATTALRRAADAVVRDPAYAPPASAVFTTDEQARETVDGYFLRSAGAVRCFREERATSYDDERRSADARALATNKIGHALHDLLPEFARFSYAPDVQAVAAAHGLHRPLLVQSMYIFKQPHIGGPVRAHRDATYIVSEPDTCLGYWWALEDSTVDNGCLWAVPGSHKDGVHKHFVLDEKRTGTFFEGEEVVEYKSQDYIPLPVKEGDLVVLHGALMHMSLENTSPKSRHAYSIHVVDSPPWSTYSARSWLQRPPNMPFRSLYDPPPVASDCL
jgi:phytanoyl-CoA hydroxylase